MKHTAKEISELAMMNEDTNSQITKHEVDKWWLRAVWGKFSKKEKRAWAKELIATHVPNYNSLSKQLIGRATTEICDFFNHC